MSDQPYRAIRAKHTADTITVYQAYSEEIADAAIRAGKFVSPFIRTRMTWIKPSFLWMAYRSGWATKPKQERVLAVEITRAGFEWALRNSCISHYEHSACPDRKTWETRMNKSCVRVQWDPERDLKFKPLGYRSIQIGIKGEAVDRYVDEWIVSITDVTEEMGRISGLVSAGHLEEARLALPSEEPYHLPDDIKEIVDATRDSGASASG